MNRRLFFKALLGAPLLPVLGKLVPSPLPEPEPAPESIWDLRTYTYTSSAGGVCDPETFNVSYFVLPYCHLDTISVVSDPVS